MSSTPFVWATVKSAFDKDGVQRTETFDDFCEWLTGEHELSPGDAAAKLRTPAFALVKFLPGQNEMISASVSVCTGIALDFDGSIAEAQCVGTLESAHVEITKRKARLDVRNLIERLQVLGYNSILYETASSTPEYPRVRVVMPFASPTAPDSLAAMLGPLLDLLPQPELVDIPTTTRPGGIHFVPIDKDAVVVRVEGPDYDRAPGRPPALPPPIGLEEARHAMRIEREKAGIQTFAPGDLEGDGWMRNVPIDWKTLDMYDLFTEGLGVQVEPRPRPHKTTGKKWRCECPLQSEHSKVTNSLDAVIFQEEEGYPGFYCPHQHTLTLRQLFQGTDDGSPAVLTEDLLLKYADRWVSPMAREASARKIPPSSVWYFAHSENSNERMGVAELLASRLLKKKPVGKAPNITWELIKDAYNLDKIFQYDDHFADLSFDLFGQVPFWKGKAVPAQGVETMLTDIRSYIVENYSGMCFSNMSILEAFISEANRRPFHPVYDYLSGLDWDHTSRISQIPRILNAKDHPLVPEYLRCFFVGAVARVLHNPGPHSQNGAKVDTCLVLLGPQGTKKTTFFQSLVPQENWFGSEAVGDLERDALLIIHRHWIHEMGEVDSLHRSHEAEKLKNFMSRTQDTFRHPYGRATGMFPRRFMLCGSTNQDEFLRDDTGARRWHIVQIGAGQIDTDWVIANRDQLWAEAVHLYKSGVTYYLNPELEAMHDEAAADYLETNVQLCEAIEAYMDKAIENGTKVFTMPMLFTYLTDEMDLTMKSRTDQMSVLMAIKKVNANRRNRQNPCFAPKKDGNRKYFSLDMATL